MINAGDVQGPEKVNYSCVKAEHVGIMDRRFNAYPSVHT